MVIKNNFNNKSVNPLSGYQSISKTRDNNIDNLDLDDDVDKNVIDDIIASDHEFDNDENDSGDNWDFFR